MKPLDSFSKAPRGKYGRKASCKECDAARFQAGYVPRPRQRRRGPFTGDELKPCIICGITKPLREFSLSRKETETQNAVYRSDCKACCTKRALQWYRDNAGRAIASKRRFNLEKLYGITLAEYDALLRSQGGVCAICRKAPAGTNTRDVRLAVDHCHKSGTARGLLCGACNRALGGFGDDPIILRLAITYLLAHHPRSMRSASTS